MHVVPICTRFLRWIRFLWRNIYYATEVRRIFNFADNRVANLTAVEQKHDAYTDAWKSGILVSQTGDKEHSKDDIVDE